jgi:hypothetical protein
VRRNLDVLCDLPSTVRFAAVPNAGGTRERGLETCWVPAAAPAVAGGQEEPSTGRALRLGISSQQYAGWLCKTCARWQRDGFPPPPIAKHAAVIAPPAQPPCRYELQAGVFVLTPLPPAAYRTKVLAPVCGGRVWAHDRSDQGALNTLLYESEVFGLPSDGGRFRLLHPTYNARSEVRGRYQALWARWRANMSVVHFTGSRKPWRETRATMTKGVEVKGLWREWKQLCGAI